MPLYVCPAAVIAAPCARVWEVLRNIPSDSGWMGLAVARAEPPGPLQPGQTILLSVPASMRRWAPSLEIGPIDEQQGFIDMLVTFPLGIVNHEHMTLAPAAGDACRVQFG